MSLEAWGDEGDVGPEGYIAEEHYDELKDDYEQLRALAWAIVKTQVYQDGQMSKGISLQMVAAMMALHDELIVTEPTNNLTPAQQARSQEILERRKSESRS